MNKIGIDLGGTKIEGILTDENYQSITRKRIPTNQDEGYNSILESIKNLVLELVQESDDKVSIGICTPGALSLDSGLIKNSNTQCLIGNDLQNDLKNILHNKVSIENDANCFALAEAKLGAGKDANLVFGVIMGTGVHTGGNVCYCGNQGCVETYISGPALEKRWANLTDQNQSLTQIIQNTQHPNFSNWKKSFLDDFGLSLANVIDILDPDVIVLGGGLSNIDFLYDEGKNTVYEKVFSDIIETPIVKNELGDSAGVFGACML